MRFILGDFYDLTKAHILIGRFTPDECWGAVSFVEKFKKDHPTYGCQLFPESVTPTGLVDKDIREKWRLTKDLHQVYGYEFRQLDDYGVIQLVLEEYPPYSEDDDPEVDRSSYLKGFCVPPTDFADSLLGSFPPSKTPLPVGPDVRMGTIDPALLRREIIPAPIFTARMEARNDIPKEYALRNAKERILKEFRDCEDCWEHYIEADRLSDFYRLKVIFHPEKLPMR